MHPQTASYGSWDSPINASDLASGTVRLEQVNWDGDTLYWLEGRAKEGGRNVIVRRLADGSFEDVLPENFNARTRVHEYGGGDYTVGKGRVFFTNFADQQLYETDGRSEPRKLTDSDGVRFADVTFDSKRKRLIAVVEDHRKGEHDVVNAIATIGLTGSKAGKSVELIASGYDFYSNPRLSPDGSKLAWLCWNHPNMPWDGCELWVADLDRSGRVKASARVAGGDEESIAMPQWGADGTLYLISDRSLWWNIYQVLPEWLTSIADGFELSPAQPVVEMDAEFAGAQWVFGTSSYACLDDGRLLCTYNSRGSGRLALVTPDETRRVFGVSEIKTHYTSYSYVKASGPKAAMCAGTPTAFTAVVELDLESKQLSEVRSSSDFSVDEEFISVPETIEFPTTDLKNAYGFFYAPKNPRYTAPVGQLPPLIVKSHGGPTSAASSVLNLSIQFWTSRGFAVVDVNYGGSTGFGREYRERLNGNWGVVDVADCEAAAKYLILHGKVDARQTAIAGGSAGGYTTLCALTFGEVFKAGASYYGVSDLEALAKDTHKFESRYLDRLVASYPEGADLYRSRSPINFTDQLSCPVIFMQGSEDKVVPPPQSEAMVEALKRRGLPVAYLLFQGEQHGFRKAENITRALESELYFYARIFGFQTPKGVEPVEIMNLPVPVV